jgi:hypothetical protein
MCVDESGQQEAVGRHFRFGPFPDRLDLTVLDKNLCGVNSFLMDVDQPADQSQFFMGHDRKLRIRF